MPSYGGGDTLRQTIDILLRTAGTDDLARLKDLIVDLTAKQYLNAEASKAQGDSTEATAAILRSGSADLANLTKLYVGLEAAIRKSGEATDEWADLQSKLGEMQRRSEGEQASAAQAVRDGTQAVRDRMASLQGAEQAERDFAEKTRQAMEIVRQTEGEAKRARIDAYAQADEAAQRNAAILREANAGIARAEALATVQTEELARKQDAAAGSAAWLAQQDIQLASALQGLALSEQTAATATVTHIAAVGKSSPEMDAYNRRVGAMSRGFLELSRGIEDFAVAGPLGVLNNIPGVAYDIGVAMGKSALQVNVATAAISVAGTGLYLLWRNWDGLMQGMGQGKIQTEAEAMEELGKKTHKTAVETERLIELKKQESSTQAMQSGLSDEQAEQKKIVEEAMKGPAFDKIRDALVESSPELLEFTSRDAGAASRAARKREEELKNTSTPFGGFRARTPEEYTAALQTDPTMQKLRAEQFNQLQLAAGALMGSAATTTGNLDFLIAAVGDKKNRGKFPAGLLPTLESATETGQKRSAAIDLAAETREGDDEAFMERRKVARELKAQKERQDAEKQRRDKAQDEQVAKEKKDADQAAKADVANANFAADAANDAEANAKKAAEKAARDAEARAKRDAAAAAKAARDARPANQIEHEARPTIDNLVGQGVRPGDAHSAVVNEMQRLMAHGLSLEQARAETDAQVPAFLQQYAMRLQFLERQEATRRMQMQQVGANRGGGLPPLQNTVPGWR